MSRADREYKMALISILVLTIVSLGYFMYIKYYKVETKESEEEKVEVINIFTNKKDDLTQIDLTGINEKLVLQKKDNKFQLLENNKLELDPIVINALLDTLTSFNASKVIGENVKNLSDFGLELPKISVTYKLVNGKGKKVEIGDVLPQDRGYYIKISGENKVYKIEKNIADNIILDLQKIRSKKVVTFEKDSINMFALSNNSQVSYEVFRENTKSANWVIKKPYEFKADQTKITEILNNISDFKVKEFIDGSKKNLDDYGLKKPSKSMKLTSKDGKYTNIYFGSIEKAQKNDKVSISKDSLDGEDESEEDTEKVQGIYIMKEGSSEILLIEQNPSALIGYEFKDIANKNLEASIPYNVKEIEISIGMKKDIIKIDLGKNDKKEDDTIFLNNVKLKDKETYNSFINKFNGIVASSVDPTAKPLTNGDITISAKLNGTTTKISFVKKSDNEYYVLKNDKYVGYIIGKVDYDKIIEAVKKIK